MHSQSSSFDPHSIQTSLHAQGLGWICVPEYFSSIPSSNDYLLRMPESVHGRVCIADYQTRGRGRRGKQWHATSGSNLMFSIGWKPRGQVQSELSLLVGLALADALHKSGIEGLGLKWPNDVLLNGRKLAGILIESRVMGAQMEFVIGIGLNVSHREEDLESVERPWTDLAQHGNFALDRQQLLVALLGELGYRLEQMEREGFEPVRRDWIAYHEFQGEVMQYQYRGETRIGRVCGLRDDGALLLNSEDQVVAVTSGEISSLRAV